MRDAEGLAYVRTLVFAAALGVPVAFGAVLFQTAIHDVIHVVWEVVPEELGWSEPAWWYVILVPGLAGLLVAAAVRLPGHGGHSPLEGLGAEPIAPMELASILPAALATLGLGLVLGPEAPLIALGMGLGILSTKLIRRDAPQQALGLMAAAGSFAAVASIFGSPVIGAVLVIEAAGLGGAMLPLVLLPGLIASGIGSLVFIGLGSFSGFSTAAWELSPFPLQEYGGPGWGDFGWTVVLSVALALVAFVIMELARWGKRLVERRLLPLTVAAGLAVGGLAIAYHYTTDESPNDVLFSGETGFAALFASAATVSVSTLALLFVFKGLAWGISLGNFRGGPTFPALYLGVVAGLMATHLPGYEETEAVAALSGAMCVAVLRLPLSSVMIASLLSIQAGLAVAPLVIVAVVVSYLVSIALTTYVDSRVGARPVRRDAGRPQLVPDP
jgi:H+/Cl- antiporter ClcA